MINKPTLLVSFNLIILDEVENIGDDFIKFIESKGIKVIAFASTKINEKINSYFKLIYRYSLKDAVIDNVSVYIFDASKKYYASLAEDMMLSAELQTTQIFSEKSDELIGFIDYLLDVIMKQNQQLEELNDININMIELQKIDSQKRKVLQFEELLKVDTKEKEWQIFFEENQWIFGYGLNYIYTKALDEGKLEQILDSGNFQKIGKRVDGLMKTAGFIKSISIVEIKDNKTSLLSNKYRNVWSPSRDLIGAISQLQEYSHRTMTSINSRIILKDSDGFDTEEAIFNISPRLILVIGSLEEFIKHGNVNVDMFKSFELFRNSINNIDIITYDELYERVKHMIL
ncbi:MAG: DUF4263 domain-containing protein [Firmicutes bacterium]|nr:DUF4263 domain-containing protein [Bacillota bacterium]